MSMRRTLFALAGCLTTLGAAAAKPPDLPAEPLVEGREPTPVVREFFDVDGPRTGAGALGLAKDGVAASPLADFVGGVRDVLLNRLTMPLGAAPVRK